MYVVLLEYPIDGKVSSGNILEQSLAVGVVNDGVDQADDGHGTSAEGQEGKGPVTDEDKPARAIGFSGDDVQDEPGECVEEEENAIGQKERQGQPL